MYWKRSLNGVLSSIEPVLALRLWTTRTARSILTDVGSTPLVMASSSSRIKRSSPLKRILCTKLTASMVPTEAILPTSDTRNNVTPRNPCAMAMMSPLAASENDVFAMSYSRSNEMLPVAAAPGL